MKPFLTEDDAENSIMQTISIAVSAILIAAGLITAPSLINNARDANAKTDLANVSLAQVYALANKGRYYDNLMRDDGNSSLWAVVRGSEGSPDGDNPAGAIRYTTSDGAYLHAVSCQDDDGWHYLAKAISTSSKVFYRSSESTYTATSPDDTRLGLSGATCIAGLIPVLAGNNPAPTPDAPGGDTGGGDASATLYGTAFHSFDVNGSAPSVGQGAYTDLGWSKDDVPNSDEWSTLHTAMPWTTTQENDGGFHESAATDVHAYISGVEVPVSGVWTAYYSAEEDGSYITTGIGTDYGRMDGKIANNDPAKIAAFQRDGAISFRTADTDKVNTIHYSDPSVPGGPSNPGDSGDTSEPGSKLNPLPIYTASASYGVSTYPRVDIRTEGATSSLAFVYDDALVKRIGKVYARSAPQPNQNITALSGGTLTDGTAVSFVWSGNFNFYAQALSDTSTRANIWSEADGFHVTDQDGRDRTDQFILKGGTMHVQVDGAASDLWLSVTKSIDAN